MAAMRSVLFILASTLLAQALQHAGNAPAPAAAAAAAAPGGGEEWDPAKGQVPEYEKIHAAVAEDMKVGDEGTPDFGNAISNMDHTMHPKIPAPAPAPPPAAAPGPAPAA